MTRVNAPWTIVEDICQRALEQHGADRARFLDAACGDDEYLRAAVESLLSHEERSETFLHGSALEVVARAVAIGAPQMLIGRSLGPYVIQSFVGAGGMGEVYRGRDRSLDRDVAIKVLPASVSGDAERLARFRHEAQTVAALSHSNIAHVYGFEDDGDVRALAMELVEGPTLAAMIARGPLPIADALRIAEQIADALEVAHERGIVHRDLKPGNIKVRPDGLVKVLDFGLAKTMEPPAASMSTKTEPGLIFGTAAYMPPEQARGLVVDRRADVWAFGCVLFEMITGRRAFAGDDVATTLAAVVSGEPAWNLLPLQTPSALRRLLRRCLAKDPRQRFPELGAVRLEISDIRQAPLAEVDGDATTFRRRARLGWIVAGLLMCATASLGVVVYSQRQTRAPASGPEMRVELTTPRDIWNNRFALSPDGSKLAYSTADSFWLRSLESGNVQKLTAESAEFPFWSADGQSIGFFADFQLKRFDLTTGLTQIVARAPIGMGGTWNAEGTILYTPSHSSPVWKVHAGRADAEPLRLAAGQVGQRFPQFLPDGRHFIYLAMGSLDVRGVYVGSLDSPETHRLVPTTDWQPAFAAPDLLLFQRDGLLFAQRLDLRTYTTIGGAVPIAPHVALVPSKYNSMALTASAMGQVAFRQSGGLSQLTWTDQAGRRIANIGEPDEARPYSARLSPDGRTVVLDRLVEGNLDVWTVDTERGTSQRITQSPVREAAAVWSPDGRRVAFASERSGLFAIYVKTVGSDREELLSASSQPQVPQDWSADGRFITFMRQSAEGGNDDWLLPLEGDRQPFPIATTSRGMANTHFSPNSGWVTYISAETGRQEAYVRRIGSGAASVRVSTTGSTWTLWRHDGQGIFYEASDGRVMSVPLTFKNNEVTPGVPIPLFQLGSRHLLDVAPDDRRFLVLEEVEPPAPITLILNWKGPHR